MAKTGVLTQYWTLVKVWTPKQMSKNRAHVEIGLTKVSLQRYKRILTSNSKVMLTKFKLQL